jgi:sulfite reductase alpha subunit-like flavoprotein
MIKIQDLKGHPGLLVALAAVILPFTVPLVFLLFPVLVMGALYWLASYNATRSNADVEINANAIPRGPASENEQPISIAAKLSTQPKPSSSPVNSQDSNGAVTATTLKTSAPEIVPTPSPTSKPAVAPPAAGPKAVGGAAILARLKAQKAARAAAEAEAKDAQAKQKGLTILYASQLGTAAEIAKNIHSEAEAKGIKSHVAAMNDFGFENISAEKTPIVVIVASSTGDGDAPDNSSKFYNEVKRRSNAEDRLKGVYFTVLGLGDSNYTRYMAVPRVFKNRFLEMGATTFYEPVEADEVDGLEEIVDEWISKLWTPVEMAIEAKKNIGDGGKSGGEIGEDGVIINKVDASTDRDANANALEGVPALPKLRIALQWADESTAAAVHATESSGPTPEQLSYRDSFNSTDNEEFTGLYSPDQPFWATITDANLLTATFPTSQATTTATTTADVGNATSNVVLDNDLDRRVLHMEVDISGSGMEQYYKPGDSIGIVPENNPNMVDQIIEKVGCDPAAVFSVTAPSGDISNAANGSVNGVVGSNGDNTASKEKLLSHLKWPCTVRNAFLHGCDLTTAPRKSLLRVLAEHCSNNEEKQRLLYLCSRQGRDLYAVEMLAARPSLLDLFKLFPSCKPPLDALLDALPALPPRMYSITCSPMSCPDKIQVAFTIVKYSPTSYDKNTNCTHSTEREGVATTWLDRLCTPLVQENSAIATAPPSVPLRVPIFLRQGGAFKTPSDLTRPWIMIGPGTGVAPFRGFLQERRARLFSHKESINNGATSSMIGECWLYFGCRRPDLDFLYESDLKSFQQDGTLTRLEVAFSRSPQQQNQLENPGGISSLTTEGRKKVYVQHLMAQHSTELYKLFIEQKGFVFVCGDGATMAKDVHATLITILATGGKVTEQEAAAQLMALAKEGRYVRDIWS